jgi:hypothetical protein
MDSSEDDESNDVDADSWDGILGLDEDNFMQRKAQRADLRRDKRTGDSGRGRPAYTRWTQIDRRLVSPEVLERAGVRYEARPAFVAVLGVLGRAEMEEYERRSAEVRRSRIAGAAPLHRHPTRGRTPGTGLASDAEDSLRNEGGKSCVSQGTTRREAPEAVEETRHKERRKEDYERGQNVQLSRDPDTNHAGCCCHHCECESRTRRGGQGRRWAERGTNGMGLRETLSVLGALASLISLAKDVA